MLDPPFLTWRLFTGFDFNWTSYVFGLNLVGLLYSFFFLFYHFNEYKKCFLYVFKIIICVFLDGMQNATI